MYNISLRIVKDTAAAEDIMQESFLRAFGRLTELREDAHFGAWLKRIVVNHSIDYYRKQKRWNVERMEDPEDSPVDYEPEGLGAEEANYPDEALYNVVQEEIEKLPEGYKLIIILHLLEGYDYDEIAEIMGIAPSTVRSQYARGRKRLAANLKRRIYGQI
jgi:RNA polymerase sigma-70 factor (ECF subfamily)